MYEILLYLQSKPQHTIKEIPIIASNYKET